LMKFAIALSSTKFRLIQQQRSSCPSDKIKKSKFEHAPKSILRGNLHNDNH
jgi:hypothetical protein